MVFCYVEGLSDEFGKKRPPHLQNKKLSKMVYVLTRAIEALCACIFVSEILFVTAFSPSFLVLQRASSPTTNRRVNKASSCFRMSGDGPDFADLETDKMNRILELQRQTAYMNRYTTSSYLNKIQYDMAVNMKTTSVSVQLEKKPEVKWPIILSIEKKLRKIAGNALDLVFASIFYMSRESKSTKEIVKKSSFPIWHKAILASQAIGSKLRCLVVSIVSIGHNLHRCKPSKTSPSAGHGPT